MEPQITPASSSASSLPHPHGDRYRASVIHQPLRWRGEPAASGVGTVGISHRADIHICLRSLHYLRNTSVGNEAAKGNGSVVNNRLPLPAILCEENHNHHLSACGKQQQQKKKKHILATKKMHLDMISPGKKKHYRNDHPSNDPRLAVLM